MFQHPTHVPLVSTTISLTYSMTLLIAVSTLVGNWIPVPLHRQHPWSFLSSHLFSDGNLLPLAGNSFDLTPLEGPSWFSLFIGLDKKGGRVEDGPQIVCLSDFGPPGPPGPFEQPQVPPV